MSDRESEQPPRSRAATPDPERIEAFEMAVRAACHIHGFDVVHFQVLDRPPGYLPWISAHFEQLPLPKEKS